MKKHLAKKQSKKSRIPVSTIREVYDGLNTISDAADIGSDIADLIDAAGDLNFGNMSNTSVEYQEAMKKLTSSMLSLTDTLVQKIPICGPMASMIVNELDQCFEKGYDIITNHIAQLKYVDAMCDYYTGAISTSDLVDKLSDIKGIDQQELQQYRILANIEEKLAKNGYKADHKSSSDWDSIGHDVYDDMSSDEKKDYGDDDKWSGGGKDDKDGKGKDGDGDWQGDTTDKGKKDNDTDMDDADHTEPKRDPLIIDLGERGIKLSGADKGVYFDLDNNGTAERTSWTTGEDGFLALDRNGNKIIDNGSELFGDSVIMANGNRSSSGFEALSELDENEDGVINEDDAVFGDLRVWVDANNNGITDKGELKTLAEENIASIALEHDNSEKVDGESGTVITETASVTFGNGTVGDISEHWFRVNAYDTTDRTTFSDDDRISSIDSFGNIVSLNDAIYNDKSGKLLSLVEDFKHSEQYMEKRILVKKILYTITDAESIEADSRGTAIDARDLHVVEEFLGRKFNGTEGNSIPNSNAADILRNIYANVENMYFNLLNNESNIGEYIDTISYAWADGEKYLDTSLFESTIEGMIANGENPENVIMLGASWLYAYDKAFDKDTLEHLKEKFADYADVMDAISKATVVLGSEENDELTGTAGREIIFGDLGDDTIHGGAGNDTLFGGKGNDTLYGGYGNDKYIFNAGDGYDIINEDNSNSAADSIVFGAGIEPDDIKVIREGNDMILNIGTEGDSIRLVRQYNDSWYRVENFEFANGKKLTADDLYTAAQTIHGSGVIKDYTSGYGSRDATLIGDKTDDTIYGYSGDDTLIGGQGNDVLYGGYGNDTYIYNKGDGADTINEDNSNSIADRIVFGEGISANDITVTRDGDDMVLNIGTEGDSIRLVRQYNDSWYRVENFEFADGEIVKADDFYDQSLTISGSGKFGDYNSGYGTRDTTLIGADTDDTISGYNGNDTLIGSKGNDVLYGGYGNDTYIFNLGDGADTINEDNSNSAADRIVFGEGIGPDDIKVIRDGDDMVLNIGTEGDSIRLVRQYNDSWYRVENFEFANGKKLTADDLYTAAQTIHGSGVIKDYTSGYGSRDATLIGDKTDDTIYGYSGDDTLIGGQGNDVLYGGYGNDTYIYNKGDGADTINEDNSNSIADRIVFGEGISANDITVTRDGDDMVLNIGTEGDSIRLVRQYNDSWYRVENFEFADGEIVKADDFYNQSLTISGSGKFGDYNSGYGTRDTTLIGADTDDTISGYNGNDTLIGGQGNDVLYGGYGNDTYIFNLGDGADNINEDNSNSAADRVVFGEGISADDITVTRDGNDMILLVGDKGDSLRITRQYNDSWYRVENFEFANGDIVTADQLYDQSLTISGSGEFGDYNSGYGTRDTTLIGADTDDTISGYNGNDTIIGGKGEDVLYGGYGNDTYIFNIGDGADTINEDNSNSAADRIVFGKGITAEDITVTKDGNDMVLLVGDKGDSIRLVRQYNDSWYRVESIEFESGLVKSVSYTDFDKIQDIAAQAKEDALLESGVDALNDIYSEDGIASDLIAESDNTIIADVTDSTSVSDENNDIADLTDLQTMLLVENMSAFADDTKVSEGIKIDDITSETASLDQLLVSSSIQ
ncbi:MAG TPA: calcium-binding protein [Ruminococcus flavefaciens]|nr:calcium-binding protein [Ruminococcus flavefaciens]